MRRVALFLFTVIVFPNVLSAEDFSRLVSPGPISSAHERYKDCTTCHTPFQGVDGNKCISCHASNPTLLGRESTRFHAEIKDCRGCHREHEGGERPTTSMDHTRIIELQKREEDGKGISTFNLVWWLRHYDEKTLSPKNSEISLLESSLNCASCHSTKDKHQSLFGSDCAECHSTKSWAVKSFKHPSPSSRDCAECHQAPPSHYMMHFEMVSKRAAGVEHANVRQCYLCHETTSWNDIKGVGWYKHH